jgi:hypothetical protein
VIKNGLAISIEIAFGVEIFEAAEDLIEQNEDRFEREPGVMAAQQNFKEISKEIYENNGQQAVELGFGRSMRTGRGKGFEFHGNTTLSAKVLRKGDFTKTTGADFDFQAGVFTKGAIE